MLLLGRSKYDLIHEAKAEQREAVRNDKSELTH